MTSSLCDNERELGHQTLEIVRLDELDAWKAYLQSAMSCYKLRLRRFSVTSVMLSDASGENRVKRAHKMIMINNE